MSVCIKLTTLRCRRARKRRSVRSSLINVGAITEVDGFSDRWNVPPGPDVSYSSAALSY
jgi:hypothetical protein